MKYLKEFEEETGKKFEEEIYDNGAPYYSPKVKVKNWKAYVEWLESKLEHMKILPCTRHDGRQTMCGAYRDGMCANLKSNVCVRNPLNMGLE